MNFLTYKYRVYVTRAQASSLDEMLGAFCDLYNAGLQQRIEAHRRCGVSVRYIDQARELKAVRACDERLARYSFTAQQQVLRRLDNAFQGFFRRLKEGARKAGYPRFKARSRFDSADFRIGDGVSFKRDGRISVTGIAGHLKVKWHRPFPDGSEPVSAVLSRSGGKWYVCFQIRHPAPDGARVGSTVGIDLGLSSLVALSDGQTEGAPQWVRNGATALRRRQRALARCRKHSAGARRAKRAVARHQRKLAACRRDYLHRLSRRIVAKHAHIAMENLDVGRLARSMLSKSIYNASWGILTSMLTYKAANAGGSVVMVDPRGTSQTCPECGTIKAKALSEREHRCECGAVIDRDVAAAMVIHHRAFGFWPGHGLWNISQPVAA